MIRHPLVLVAILLGSTSVMNTIQADEGMWLFEGPPRELLRQKYGFDLTDAWLKHAQLASVRFNNGGSGGFVSPEGLIVTNHHIAGDALQKLSTPGKDYLALGYLARTRADELKCPDLELNVLQSVADVTAEVNAAVTPGMTSAEAFAARRAVMSEIEKKSLAETGLRSDVVTLYQGGKYHLYRSKKYTDVRLVFAPEQKIAFFGGDTDNFEYPRYCLDVAFFRAYEKDQPARIEHYFRWSTTGPAEGDLVFVTGHPGTTNRLETLAKLEHRRDITLPYFLARMRMLEAILSQFSQRGPRFEQMAREDLFRVANSRKAYTGMYQGLLDPTILARKAGEENAMRAKIDANPEWKKQFGHAWDAVAKAEKTFADFELDYYLLERGDAFDVRLFEIARHLVRMAQELKKPSSERLREYRDSNLESLKLQLFSPAPIYPELERARLAATLSFLAEQFGGEHPHVKLAFAGKSPAARADELVGGTMLADPEFRKQLAEGGLEAVTSSDDTMIKFALLVDEKARELRGRYENEIDEPERQANAAIAGARFELLGSSVAPDATFTLRLAFGVVRGYKVEGEDLPFYTTFAGAYQRAREQNNRDPFELPRRWLEGKDKLDLDTPFDFVSTADTIGGNSGSPVLNRAGELVGVNFDRNRHGLVRNFVYTDEQARHISVHCRSVLEALSKLYDARHLFEELTRKE